MEPAYLIYFIVILALAFDYTNGFHDAANVISTVIATRVLTPFIAILMAGALNTLGATLISGVAQTIATGLVHHQSATQLIILCAIIGAITWNLITWYFGIPSSSSYALIGGLIGAALIQNGMRTILWQGVLLKVILPMIFSPLIGFILAFFLMKILYRILNHRRMKNKEHLFAPLQIGSASIVAFAHGLNDAQKSMGIITLGLFAGGFILTPSIPLWVILSCALMMGLGSASGGFRIVRTMGYKITTLAPVQGFAAEMSTSLVILVASFFGMPVSSTHMIAGSITGVGAAKNLMAVKWSTFKTMAIAWLVTLPGAGIVAILAYKVSLLFTS